MFLHGLCITILFPVFRGTQAKTLTSLSRTRLGCWRVRSRIETLLDLGDKLGREDCTRTTLRVRVCLGARMTKRRAKKGLERTLVSLIGAYNAKGAEVSYRREDGLYLCPFSLDDLTYFSAWKCYPKLSSSRQEIFQMLL